MKIRFLAAGSLLFAAACASEIAVRSPANDPTSPHSEEAPAPRRISLDSRDPTFKEKLPADGGAAPEPLKQEMPADMKHGGGQ